MGSSGRITSARHKRLLDQFETADYVRVSELAQAFNISEITIRRDLDELAERGLIERTHGGARRLGRAASRLRGTSTGHDREKAAIAATAARLIHPHDTVLMSGGTTTLAIFHQIAQTNLRVVTNNAMIIGALDETTEAELFVLGGEYDRRTRAMNGELTNLTLSQVHGTICFLGTNAISRQTGLTSTIYAAAMVNQQMVAQCPGNVVVVADSSKVGLTANFASVPLAQVRTLITDDGADPDELAAYRAGGIEVVVCPLGRG